MSQKSYFSSCVFFAFLSLLLVFATHGSTPMSGTYTIGHDPGDDYSTFTAAATDLMTHGVGEGGVIFFVEPGNYPERLSLSAIEGTSESAQVIFQANGGEVVLNGTGTDATNDAMITLNGVSWVTFDGISVLDGGTSVNDNVEYGYLITGTATQGSNHNTIKNCFIQLGGGTDPELKFTRGVAFISNATQVSGTNNFNTIHNITIDKVGNGISVRGRTQALTGNVLFADIGNVITNNILGSNIRIGFSDPTGADYWLKNVVGIFVSAQKKVMVYDNVIDSVFWNPYDPPVIPRGARGIAANASSGEIYNNKINFVQYHGGGGCFAQGMNLSPLVNDTLRIYNNFISNVMKSNDYPPPSHDPSVYVSGIYLNMGGSGGGLAEIYYNTVVLESDDVCDFPSAALYSRAAGAGPGVVPTEIYNNIFINNIVPSMNYTNTYGITSYALIEGNPHPGTMTSDYNLFYVSDPNAVLIQKGRGLGPSDLYDYHTIAEWTEATGNDEHSVSKPVNFVDVAAGDLHLAGASISDPQLAGTPVEWIDFDIDYDPRGEIPGMGADEYEPSELVVNLSGTVTNTDDGSPLHAVQITVGEFLVQTNTSGQYSLSIEPGEYELHATKEGFENYSTELVIPEEDTIYNFSMTPIPIPMSLVSGQITGSDHPGTGIEGAQIEFTGQSEYLPVYTDADGYFEIELPADITYTYRAAAAGYLPHEGTLVPEEGTYDMGVLVLEEYPFKPLNVVATDHPDHVLVSWDAPIAGLFTDFRHDDGIIQNQLGYPSGTENSVLGSVYRRHAHLHEISWYLTGEGGPHVLVNVFVFGLDESGLPDHNNLVYVAANVNNTDGQWNTYTLGESLELPDGFFIGLSVNGFLGLATDDGTSSDWPFQPETHFGTSNFLQNPFVTIESMGFEVNFMMRGYGIDFGPANHTAARETAGQGNDPQILPQLIRKEEPVVTEPPRVFTDRVLESYNIYRLEAGSEDDQTLWTLLQDAHADNEYADYGWGDLAPGEFLYAVEAVYTHDLVSAAAFSNVLNKEEQEPIEVTIYVHDAGDPDHGIADAHVMLTHEDKTGEQVYEGFTGADGVLVFADVAAGVYHLLISHESYHNYEEFGLELTESTEITAGLDLITGIHRLDDIRVIVYPNPATDAFVIKADAVISRVEVHDMHGRLIFRSEPLAEFYQVTSSHWKAGLYFVSVFFGTDQTKILKLQIFE